MIKYVTFNNAQLSNAKFTFYFNINTIFANELFSNANTFLSGLFINDNNEIDNEIDNSNEKFIEKNVDSAKENNSNIDVNMLI